MKNRKPFAALACILAFAGCATAPVTESSVRANTVASTDPYTGIREVNGPMLTVTNLEKFYSCDYRLRTKPGAQEAELYLAYSAESWAFLDIANDRDGHPLSVRVINRGVRPVDGEVVEQVGVGMTVAYLAAHRATGINLRIDGSGGSVVVEVPAEYVAGFLAANN